MVRSLKFMAPALAVLGLMFASSNLKAADAPAATGTVTGTIVDKDGKPVADAKIQIRTPRQRPGGAGGAGGDKKPADPAKLADAPAPGAGGPGGGGAGGRRGQQTPPVAEGTSDKDGKFSIASVPAGEYSVISMIQGKGFARGQVTVKAGESVSVDLKLADMPQRGQGGPGGQGGAGGNRPGRGGAKPPVAQ